MYYDLKETDAEIKNSQIEHQQAVDADNDTLALINSEFDKFRAKLDLYYSYLETIDAANTVKHVIGCVETDQNELPIEFT